MRREAELSYEGQTHLLRIAIPGEELSIPKIRDHFRNAFLERFGASREQFGGLDELLDEMPIRLMNLRTTVIGIRPKHALRDLIPKPRTSLDGAAKGSRRVWAGGEWIECPTYERAALPWGAELDGPAVVEQPDTSVWLEPSTSARVDEAGNLVVKLG